MRHTQSRPARALGAPILALTIVSTLAFVLPGASCGPPKGDACADIDCGEHGQCRESAGSAYCECDPGYHPEGAVCVADSDAGPDNCGNEVAETGEACDGSDLREETCDGLGYYGGSLACRGDCTYDLSSCEGAGWCGDAIIQTDQEECDGANLDNETCMTRGYETGVLSCDESCGFDTSQCLSPNCGNGVIDSGETCDDNNATPGDGCGDNCQVEEGWECTGVPSQCTRLCGNGVLDAGEVCDATLFGGWDCTDFGFYGGSLTCNATCDASDTLNCSEYCGDSMLNGLEQCDDGDTSPGDGCDGSCNVETGWGCVGEPSVCHPNPVTGEVIITEILYDPASPGDPNGEWIELMNVGGSTVNLQGCALSDGEDTAQIDAGVQLQPGAYAVLGYADNVGTTGFTPDFVYGSAAGSLQLNNVGDNLTFTCGVTTVDAVTYATASPWPSQVGGTAIQLDPLVLTVTGNDYGGHWCHASQTFGSGDYGTPGQPNALCDTTIDWCRLQWPAQVTVSAGTPFTVYARVYEDPITEQTTGTDPSPVIRAQIGYAPDGTDPIANPGSWTWIQANPNLGYDGTAAGEPNNDEYMLDLTIGTTGSYDYAARFSRDGGITWIYCDLDDSSGGYSTAQAGDATIN